MLKPSREDFSIIDIAHLLIIKTNVFSTPKVCTLP
jgi:hypothetical protein